MRTLTLKMLLLTFLTQVTFAAVNNFPETSIVEHMERAQSEISIPNHITRDYRLGRPDAKVESYGVAEVDFRPPGRYTVTKRSGSHSCDAAVKYILQHEIEIAMSIKNSAAAKADISSPLLTPFPKANSSAWISPKYPSGAPKMLPRSLA